MQQAGHMRLETSLTDKTTNKKNHMELQCENLCNKLLHYLLFYIQVENRSTMYSFIQNAGHTKNGFMHAIFFFQTDEEQSMLCTSILHVI